jgi:hypothetical protein
MEPSAIDEALSILRLAIEDLVGGRVASETTTPPKIRVGTLSGSGLTPCGWSGSRCGGGWG